MFRLAEKIKKAGLSVRKEMTFLILINMALGLGIFAFIYFYTFNVMIVSVGVGMVLFINYFYLSRYSSIIAQDKDENIKNFVSIFTFFKIYLKNGYNVYTALKEISAFANPYVLEKLSDLIHEIDGDKTVTPFIHFARSFDLLIIEQLMINVFQMIDEGNNTSYITQFEMLFNKLSEENYEKEYLKKEKKIGSTTIFPLIASGILILMICFGIVAVIGEMLNGI